MLAYRLRKGGPRAMDTTREGLTGLTKLQPGLPSTWDTGVSGDKGITYTALPQSRDGAMVRFKTRNSSSGRGLLVPSAHLLLYYTSEPFRKLSQRASRRSCWIQGQASLSPRAQRLGFESSISNNRLRVPGTLLGVGRVQLLPSGIYCQVKSESVLAKH